MYPVEHQPPEPHQTPAGPTPRPARVLAGWLPEATAVQLLAANGPIDATATGDKLSAFRAAVSSRDDYVPPASPPGSPPGELDGHAARFWAHPAHAGFVAEGWAIRTVDLRTVIAAQDRVWLDRVQIPRRPATILEIVRVTLPADPGDNSVGAQAVGNGIMITSASPNLRVTGVFVGPTAPDGPTVAGFFVGVTPSVVQVADFHGRLVLRDGYHRAYGLLAHGVYEVPALVRSFGTAEQILPAAPGILPSSMWLGSRPPTLPDYADDAVSIEARLLRRDDKVITVQVAEFG
jgi:hypothetical protein